MHGFMYTETAQTNSYKRFIQCNLFARQDAPKHPKSVAFSRHLPHVVDPLEMCPTADGTPKRASKASVIPWPFVCPCALVCSSTVNVQQTVTSGRSQQWCVNALHHLINGVVR